LADPIAQDRMKLKVPGEYAVYLDAVSAEELTQLLQQLASDDRKGEDKLLVGPPLPR